MEQIEQLMASANIRVDYVGDINIADIILLVNGCSHACKEEEMTAPASFPIISIQGNRLRYKPVLEKDIPRLVFEEIKAVKKGE